MMIAAKHYISHAFYYLDSCVSETLWQKQLWICFVSLSSSVTVVYRPDQQNTTLYVCCYFVNVLSLPRARLKIRKTSSATE